MSSGLTFRVTSAGIRRATLPGTLWWVKQTLWLGNRMKSSICISSGPLRYDAADVPLKTRSGNIYDNDRRWNLFWLRVVLFIRKLQKNWKVGEIKFVRWSICLYFSSILLQHQCLLTNSTLCSARCKIYRFEWRGGLNWSVEATSACMGSSCWNNFSRV